MNREIKNIILNVVSKYNYSTIILFGSRAKNEYWENSDYDILVIMNEEMDIIDLRKIQQNIRKELALKNIDADVLVKSKSMVDAFKDKKGTVIYEAMREGVTLWLKMSILMTGYKKLIKI